MHGSENVKNFISISAIFGWCINYNNMQGIGKIKKIA
jgi:hypothetical protein